jgi:stage II sporulation SpoE-like protein
MRPDERRALQVLVLGVAFACVFAAGLFVAEVGTLYFLPILGAAKWFGERAGIAAGALAAALLVGDVVLGDALEPWALLFVLPLLPISGSWLGRLFDRRRQQSRELVGLRAMQAAFAPPSSDDLPLLEVATRYLPAQGDIAGDFHLLSQGPNDATIFAIGDVAGKGTKSAQRAAFVRATIAASAPFTEDPASLLRATNSELVRQYGLSADIITVLCVTIGPDGTLTWSSAGHPPPLAIADGRALGQSGPTYPLGISSSLPVQARTTVLPRSGIVLYSDGLTDARPPGRTFEPFGEKRLARALAELEDPAPEEVAEHLVQAALRFSRGRLPDDLCLIAIRSKLPDYAGRPHQEDNGRVPDAAEP